MRNSTLGIIAGSLWISSMCEAETSLANLPNKYYEMSYNQCTEKALAHPDRMPSIMRDRSFHTFCTDGKEVIVICFEQVMNVTRTNEPCSMEQAWKRFDIATEHGLLD